MLAFIEGIVVDKSPSRVIVSTGGLGYEVNISSKTYEVLPSVGGVAKLHLYTHVREDILALFGFANVVDKETFLSLLKVPKIGAKLGLSILGEFDTPTLISTILNEDVASLKRCSGVGQKTAELIIVQLRDKLQSHPSSTVQGSQGSARSDAISALSNLGYKDKEIDAVIQKAYASGDTVEAVIKKSLQLLQK